MGSFPSVRHRRLRLHHWMRNLVAENFISTCDLVLPLFVKDGSNIKKEVDGMSGVFIYSIDNIFFKIEEAILLGIPAVAVFPCIEDHLKTPCAKEAYNPQNIVCKTIRGIKEKFANKIGVIADVALDPYNTNGHCGIFEDGKIDNDVTLEALCKQALVLCAAGADIVAPSAMMDGRIKNIRHALSIGNFDYVSILSYSAKYSSCYYSGFRSAMGLQNMIIDKSSYQIDFRNSNQAMAEIASDIDEGADIVMIKPAMLYGDIIKEASQKFNVPIFAYQVSGEYSMLINFGMHGMIESLTSIKRAGAKSIFTYAAIEVAKFINNK